MENYLLEDVNRKLFDIISELGACERKDTFRVSESYKYSADELRGYLGTYFPRSYIESLNIWNNLLKERTISCHLNSKFRNGNTFKCLSLGCGCGGDSLGLIDSILKFKLNFDEKNSDSFPLDIFFKAVDRNENALNLFTKLCQNYYGDNEFLDLTFDPTLLTKPDYIEIENIKEFDFITCFKSVNEIIKFLNFDREQACNLYYRLIDFLCRHLSEKGLLVLLDVTDRRNNEFLATTLVRAVGNFLKEHKDYRVIVPMCAAIFQEKCGNSNCFIQQEVLINNSLSKCTYFVFAKRYYANQINFWTKTYSDSSLSCPGTKKPQPNTAFNFAYNFKNLIKNED